MATVDQTPIRGLQLPHERVSSQACLGLQASVGDAGSLDVARIAYRSALPPAEQARGAGCLKHRGSHFLAHRPDESR
jgi:hypothetical protein